MTKPKLPRPELTLFCYEVHAYFLQRGEKGEHGMEQLYCAVTDAEAVRAAVAWGNERATALGWILGCLKVHHYEIKTPEENGHIRSGRVPFHLFEWKYDWPGTLEQYVTAFEVEAKNKTTRRLSR